MQMIFISLHARGTISVKKSHECDRIHILIILKGINAINGQVIN